VKRQLFIIAAVVFAITSVVITFGFKPSQEVLINNTIDTLTIKTVQKMKVQIWSDIMCPFCYIGKRKLEKALSEFKNAPQIEIEWKSYQLNPDMKYMPGVSAYDYLAKVKGQSREWSVKMHEYVVEMAKGEGLQYDFDKAVMANSFNAHRLIQMAKQKGLGDAAEERLFKAYFMEGINMEDADSLIKIGKDIGLSETELKSMLQSDAYKAEVKKDIEEANKVGVTGVPFFVFNNKYALSGAQDNKVFLDVLTKSYDEFLKQNPGAGLKTINGKVCTPEGECK
jgi:predicted DsbA family dithiol-disulfide isomerase